MYLTTQELRVVVSLAGIFALRMLGLCMLLPVFALEASTYPHASAQLIGLAIGIYGLAQALLQIPFGILSDKYGRRPVLLGGLFLLAVGSLIAAKADTIYGLILGRVLQGSGAIGSVIIATLADHTREQVRARSMAVLGISIGLAFVVAMVLGPVLTQLFGMQAVFSFTALLAVGGIILLLFTIPETKDWQPSVRVGSLRQQLRTLLNDSVLLRLNFGIFALHALLSALFLVLPLLIRASGFAEYSLWRVYLLALALALPVALFCINRSEKRQQLDLMQLLAIGSLLLATVLLGIVTSKFGIMLGLTAFFAAFCCLEASLPTLISKHAPSNNRGAVLGVYSSLQFLGVFFGGTIGGWMHNTFGASGALMFCVGLAAAWLGVGLFSYKLRWNYG